jgi:hypothetical protein
MILIIMFLLFVYHLSRPTVHTKTIMETHPHGIEQRINESADFSTHPTRPLSAVANRRKNNWKKQGIGAMNWHNTSAKGDVDTKESNTILIWCSGVQHWPLGCGLSQDREKWMSSCIFILCACLPHSFLSDFSACSTFNACCYPLAAKADSTCPNCGISQQNIILIFTLPIYSIGGDIFNCLELGLY